MDTIHQGHLIFFVAVLLFCVAALVRLFIQVRQLKRLNERLLAELDRVRTPRMSHSPTQLIP